MIDRRWRLRVLYSGVLLFVYFGFFLMCACFPAIMASRVSAGSPATFAMWAGALIIAGSVAMTGLYTMAAEKLD